MPSTRRAKISPGWETSQSQTVGAVTSAKYFQARRRSGLAADYCSTGVTLFVLASQSSHVNARRAAPVCGMHSAVHLDRIYHSPRVQMFEILRSSFQNIRYTPTRDVTIIFSPDRQFRAVNDNLAIENTPKGIVRGKRLDLLSLSRQAQSRCLKGVCRKLSPEGTLTGCVMPVRIITQFVSSRILWAPKLLETAIVCALVMVCATSQGPGNVGW